MKLFFILAFSFLTITASGQCMDCTSIVEASQHPLSVKSLRINSLLNEKTDVVPASVAQMTNLEVLYLTDQKITSIPAFIGDLKNLKELSFAGCKLESIPEEIFHLKNLKELVLLDNSFSEEYKKQLKKTVNERMPNTKLLLDF